MRLLLGTRVYVDFPTLSAIIYPRKVVEAALTSPAFKQSIIDGMFGGIFDGPYPTPKDGLITHRVVDIRLYNDEIVAELETIDTDEVQLALDTIKHKKASIVLRVPTSEGGAGSTVRKITAIDCVHIKEDINA